MRVDSSDGVELAVHDLGGDGPPLLICHANGMLGLAYEAMATDLRRAFRVFAMDFRAHGDSSSPTGGRFDWTAMAEDATAVIGAISDGPLDTFGHSMGGAALLLAELARPGLLASAYLFEPIVLPDDGLPQISTQLSGTALRRRRVFDSRSDAMLRYASKPPLSLLQAGVLAAYVEHGFADRKDGAVELKCSPEHEAAVFAADGKPTFSMVSTVRTPATVAVSSARDFPSPATLAPYVAEALPYGRLERHDMLGHFGPLEAPRRIAAAILGFHGKA